jgi:hypothetical protein
MCLPTSGAALLASTLLPTFDPDVEVSPLEVFFRLLRFFVRREAPLE